MKNWIFLTIFAAFSLFARADFLYHDSAATTAGEFVGGSVVFGIGNLKDAGHTSHLDTENTATNGASYATTSPPAGGFPVTITLDFATAVDLSRFYLWNHSNSNGGGAPANGVGTFSLTFFDGASGGGSQIGTMYNGSALAAPASGSVDYAAQVFDFGSTYENVRSVVFTILNKQGGSTSGFVAAREIGFEGTVPPPTDFIYHDSATTTGGEFSVDFPIGDLKNAGHTSPADTEDAGASGESYATVNPATGGFPVTITLDFDSLASLEAFHLWNHTNSNSAGAPANGAGDFSLTFYDGTGGTGSQVGSTFIGSASPAPATGLYSAQTFQFGTTYSGVRSVVLSIINKQGASTAGFVAIREIGFTGTTTPIPPANPHKVIVYLVGGQSNADGYGVTSELSPQLQAPQPDIDFYHSNAGGSSPLTANQWIRLQPGSGSKPGNAGGFGPELNFGIGIHHALGSEGARIAVIKHALGGSSLHTDWIPGGDATTAGDGTAYQAFQATVTSGLAALANLYPAATVQIEGMIWHQGEADAGSTANAAAYQTRLTDFITDLRATYGSGLKFGIVQLSDNQTAVAPTGRATVKLAQAAVADADPLNYLVTTDDLPMASGSAIHFGTTGVLTIGSRLAGGMQQVPINDGDGNRINDDWEEMHWGIGNAGQDPAGNDDGDPFTNLEEFLWLTDPLVSNVISPAFQTSPGHSITWPSSPTRRYKVEASLDFETWQRLDSFIPGAAGATTSYELPADPTASRRFFRIGVHR